MSFVSPDESDVFNASSSAWLALDDDDKQTRLDTGTLYMDLVYDWIGKITDPTQSDTWPRRSLCSYAVEAMEYSGFPYTLNMVLGQFERYMDVQGATLTDNEGITIYTDEIPYNIRHANSALGVLSITEDILKLEVPIARRLEDQIYDRVRIDTLELENKFAKTTNKFETIPYIDALVKRYVARRVPKFFSR